MQYNIKITFLKNHHAINIIIAKVTHIAQEYSIIQINNQLRINCATILNANNNRQAGEYRGLAQFTSVFAFKRPLKRRRPHETVPPATNIHSVHRECHASPSSFRTSWRHDTTTPVRPKDLHR